MTIYSSSGFRRFMDRIISEGLEWLGYYYGTYRAEVVDNVGFSELGAASGDALDKLGLLKVRIPAIGDTEDTPARVAYPKVPLAGNGYGVKNLPPKGSFTWVEFENGNPDLPVWCGGWWAKGEMPSELESVDAYGWITPGGHKVLLIDDDGSEKVRIEHSLGGYVEWDFQGNVVFTNTGFGTTISLGEGASESAVLGDTLKSLMEEILDAVTKIQVLTPAGTSGPPLNTPVFLAIRQRLSTALSIVNKVK